MQLTMKDKNTIEGIQAVMDGRILVKEAALVLGRSVRQIYRMLKKLRDEGLEGLIHKNRGKTSPRKTKAKVCRKILTLVRGRYKDINDCHLQEILLREEKIKIGRETLRFILRRAGIQAKNQKKRSPYRSRRERKEAFGVMLQIDGSPHDWLEGRGPWLTLVGAKDDASNHVWARFEVVESTWAYFHLMENIFMTTGLPLSLYSDRHTIFHTPREPNIIEQLSHIKPLTQFGRGMEELGIKLIKAYSPQAKGRIENQWRTFQDRLVVELRLAKVKTLEEANQVLERFLKDYNSRFKVPPRKQESVFRKAPCLTQLDRILCLKEIRTVNKDHTVSFEGLALQIPPSKKFRSIARQKVDVLQLKDGSIEIVYKTLTVARFCPEAVSRLIKDHKTEKTLLKLAA